MLVRTRHSLLTACLGTSGVFALGLPACGAANPAEQAHAQPATGGDAPAVPAVGSTSSSGGPTSSGTAVNATASPSGISTTDTNIPPAVPSTGDTEPPPERMGYGLVSAGFYTTCAVREGVSELECWGANNSGGLDVPDGAFIDVSVGTYHACARTPDNAVRCWGAQGNPANDSGQATVPDGLEATQVSAGSNHTCALDSSGHAVCFGTNAFGQLDAPQGQQPLVEVSAGDLASCGRSEDGTVICWGDAHEQLSPVGLTEVPPGRYVSVSAGASHACALDGAGQVACWGENVDGQNDVPPGVYSAVCASTGSSCGIRDDGRTVCWGRLPNAPIHLRFTSISCGYTHACGRTEDGVAHCWGDNSFGQSDPVPA